MPHIYSKRQKRKCLMQFTSMAQGRFPDSDIMKIRIHTFHGFANDYLQEAGLISSNIIGNNFLRYSILESFIENKAFNYGKDYIIDDTCAKSRKCNQIHQKFWRNIR